jgi:type II secretory pathway pseudopilin PulG
MGPSPAARRAFSLLEALLALLVFVVVLGLLAYVASRAREAAVRSHCQNNLKQIVLAIHNYAGTYNSQLPALYSAPPRRLWANGKGDTYPQAFLLGIIPFVEADAFYKHAMDPSTNGRTWNGQIPAHSGRGPIYANAFANCYVCPADTTNSIEQTTAIGWCGSSYAGNYQVFGTEDWGPKYKIGDIPDGTSATVFIAERIAQFPGPAGRFTDPDGAPQQAYNLWAWPAGCPPSPPTAYTKPVPHNATLFAYGNLHGAARPYGYGPMVFERPQFGVSPLEADYRLVQSGHPTVVQVAMGDGSARAIAAGVSQPTWQNAILPNNSHELGPDW